MSDLWRATVSMVVGCSDEEELYVSYLLLRRKVMELTARMLSRCSIKKFIAEAEKEGAGAKH